MHASYFSVLGQLAISALCAHEELVLDAVDHRRNDTIQNRFTLSRRDWMPRKCEHGVCATLEYSTHSFAGNRTIVSVINYPPLQRLSRIGAFEAFLKRRAFTHTYWMLPHPECFFDWLLEKTQPWCVKTSHYSPDEARSRTYEAVFARNRVGAWRTVIPWHGASANETRAVDLAASSAKLGTCASPRCSAPPFSYHLCMPGATAHLWHSLLLAAA